MNLVERAKGIIMQPKSEWAVIAAEPETPASLYRGYILILAAIGPLATLLKMGIFGINMPMNLGTVRLGFGGMLGTAISSYVLGLVGIYVLALIINALAPTFGGQKDQMQALKVAAYSATPGWLGGIFHLLPLMLSFLSLLASLYGVYLLYLGLPALMGAPKERSLVYTALVLVAAFLVMLVIGFLSALFMRF